MTRPLPVRVVLPRIDPDGRARFGADLDVATILARWAAGGGPVQLRIGTPWGTVADWAGTLRRGAAHVLVVPAGRSDHDAEWFAERLGADLVCAESLDERLASLLPGQAPHPGPGMPYRQGILPVETAPEAGIDAVSTAAVSELEHLGSGTRRLSGAVPLHRCPVDTTRAASERRDELVRVAASTGNELLPVLAPEELTLSVARTLRSSGITRIRLDARPDAAAAVRAAQVVAGSAHLAVRVRVDLAGRTEPVGLVAHQVARMVQARPDATVVGGAAHLRTLAAHGALAGVRPSATLARAVREESRRGSAARERLVAGHYSQIPLVGGPHDLWWDHADQPQQHRDWLSSLIPMGGHLHLAGDHDASGWTAPVPVSDYREITAYGRLAEDADRVLAALATPDCVAAFLADAEAAWHSGGAPRRFLGAAVAGLCAVGAPCWAAGGRRLYVDRSGAVRCRPGGRVAGAVGDTFAQLRRQLRAGAGCEPAGQVPTWLPRVLSAREALQALAPTDASARASGLGQPLLHNFSRANEWPTGLGVVRVGERYLAHHAGQGTTAELGRGQAAALELSLDLGSGAAAVLSDLRGSSFSTQDVHHLVDGLITRLTGAPPPPPTVPDQSSRTLASSRPQLVTADQG